MKKIVALFSLIVVFVCTMQPISVFAVEEAPNTVVINCNAIGSDAYGKPLSVYFQNIETGEIIDRKITTIGSNEFTDIPAGEYTYIKCTLYRNENVVFDLARDVENLVVYDEQPSIFMFKIAKSATETYEGAMDDYEQGIKNDLIYASLSMAIIILLVCWIIFAIKGRKVNRMKWVARFVGHMLISAIFLLLALAITNLNSDLSFLWAVGAGLPYGLAGALFFFPKDTDKGKTAQQVRARGTAEVTVALIVGAIIGIIALPIVFISDIIKIVKNPEYY